MQQAIVEILSRLGIWEGQIPGGEQPADPNLQDKDKLSKQIEPDVIVERGETDPRLVSDRGESISSKPPQPIAQHALMVTGVGEEDQVVIIARVMDDSESTPVLFAITTRVTQVEWVMASSAEVISQMLQ